MHLLPDPSPPNESVVLARLHTLPVRFPPTMTLARLLAETLDSALLATGSALGNVQILNPATRTLKIGEQRGFGKDLLAFFSAVHLSGSACAAAFRDRRPVQVSDVTTDGNFSEDTRRVVLEAGVRAVHSTPLITPSGVLFGILSIHYPEPAVVSPRALALVEQVAERTAALIERRPQWRGVPPIAAMIAQKLATGTLPLEASAKTMETHGEGARCSGCEARIVRAQVQYEVDQDGQTYRFHLGCFGLWETKRRRLNGK